MDTLTITLNEFKSDVESYNNNIPSKSKLCQQWIPKYNKFVENNKQFCNINNIKKIKKYCNDKLNNNDLLRKINIVFRNINNDIVIVEDSVDNTEIKNTEIKDIVDNKIEDVNEENTLNNDIEIKTYNTNKYINIILNKIILCIFLIYFMTNSKIMFINNNYNDNKIIYIYNI